MFLFFEKIGNIVVFASVLAGRKRKFKPVSPVSPCWLHHPPLSWGFFFFDLLEVD